MNTQDLVVSLYEASAWVLPILSAIILHEIAHGWTAFAFGDHTAKSAGRLSLNPVHHIDPVGTILVPAILFLVGSPFLFGWARPVPVDFQRFYHERLKTLAISVAGIVMNLVVAFLLCGLLMPTAEYVGESWGAWIFSNLVFAIDLSLVLAFFNLVPLLPLDGGRVFNALLPERLRVWHQRSEPYGLLAILAILFLVPPLMELFGHADVDPVVSYLRGTVLPVKQAFLDIWNVPAPGGG